MSDEIKNQSFEPEAQKNSAEQSTEPKSVPQPDGEEPMLEFIPDSKPELISNDEPSNENNFTPVKKFLPLGAIIGIAVGAIAIIALVILFATGIIGGNDEKTHTCEAGEWVIDKAATCIEAGSQHQECKICHTVMKTEFIAAKGHQWNNAEATCQQGKECTVCHIKEEKTAHSYQKTSETTADCENAATVTYTCQSCRESYTETVGDVLGHNLSGVTPTEQQVDTSCEYRLHYICTRCGKDVEGESLYHHSYIATITKNPTCEQDGIKTLTCACGDTQTESIPKNDAYHKWIKGTTTVDSKRTDICEFCQKAKTVIDASAVTTTQISASDLADTGEIQLQNAGIAFDAATREGLVGVGDLSVSSDELAGNDLDQAKANLTPEQRNQIGDSPIYDFSVTSSGNQVAFNGTVTIALPYTPAEDENLDNIAVWYLSDSTPVAIKATYANGYLTFETTHFSY